MRDLSARRHHAETTEQKIMDKSEPRTGYTDPADDPIPDDLTEEEKAAVRRQGEFLAWLRSALGEGTGDD